MKNNFKNVAAIAVAIIMLCSQAKAQYFTTPSSGNWKIDNVNYTVDRVSLSTASSFPYAFFIDGGNLSSSNTGNVFGTDCPSGNTSAWYMLRAGTEEGKLFNTTG